MNAVCLFSEPLEEVSTFDDVHVVFIVSSDVQSELPAGHFSTAGERKQDNLFHRQHQIRTTPSDGNTQNLNT